MQDGRRVCYEKHSHAHFSIGAITGGHSHYLNQQTKQEVNAGTLVLMNPEEVHACNPIADHPWSYLMFYLDTDWLRGQQEEAGLGAHFRPFDMTASRDPVLYAGLLRLYRTLQDDQQDHLAKEVACHLFSHQLLARLTPARWSEPPPLHLSTVAGLTPSHLVRVFSRHYGMTPHAYLLNQRIRQARTLLAQGRPLVEVALATGFSDQAHFQRQFKRLVAATPGQYQSQCLPQGSRTR